MTHVLPALLMILGLLAAEPSIPPATGGLAAEPWPEAAAHWARRELLTSDDERIAHAEQHLRRYDKLLALDQRIVVEASIAEIEWRRSCE